MLKSALKICFLVFVFFSTSIFVSFAQGPLIKYYYDSDTNFPWGSASIVFKSGSEFALPFLPVIHLNNSAPIGTYKYSRDIQLEAQIIFLGPDELIENSSNSDTNFSGKVLLMANDAPIGSDSIYSTKSLKERINNAGRKGAKAVIVYSFQEDYPSYSVQYNESENTTEIPVISITLNSAQKILESAGKRSDNYFTPWSKTNFPSTEELIVRLQLTINGNFPRIENESFTFVFYEILENIKEKIVDLNSQSIKLIQNLFSEHNFKWEKSFLGYFADFDSKVFYTAHWGKGLSSQAGNFIVLDENEIDYGLIVHENAHYMLYNNWGITSSFMFEGLSMYIESMAVDKNINHNQVISFLKEERLYSLNQMTNFEIGTNPSETEIGYPASGSFIHYLLDTYSTSHVKKAYQLEGRSEQEKNSESTWKIVFEKTINELESDWLNWLAAKYNFDKKYIKLHQKKFN